MFKSNCYLTIGSLLLTIASIGLINPDSRAQKPLFAQNSNSRPASSTATMEAVAKAVIADAAERTGKPAAKLTIAEMKRQTWSDGCLGLPAKDTVCTQATVSGWRLVVTDKTQSWVYRTNMSGSLVKLDATASQTAAAAPTSEDEDNPAILPDPKPSKLPLRIVDVSSRTANNGRRKPIVVSPSPKPKPDAPIAASTQPSSAVVVVPSPQPTPVASASPKPATKRSPSSAQLNFNDVPQKYWARDFIAELAQRDIIKGSGNRFRPTDPVTNAEFAAMLSLAFPRPNVREAVDFADITPKEWAHSYLLEAYQRGFLELGPGNKMYPNRKVSRLNVLAALTRGLKYTPSESTADTLKIYGDAAAIAPEFRDSVAAATEKGLVVNYPNTKILKPNRRATRAEVAALIYQAMASTGQVAQLDSPYIVLEPK